jgi:hypothetical protein
VADIPYWSPDGAASLIAYTAPGEQTATISLADGNGAIIRRLDQGDSPFWFDQRTYGYATGAGPGRRIRIYAGLPPNRSFSAELTAGELADAVNGERPFSLVIGQVLALADSAGLIILASDAGLGREYIFRLRWTGPGAVPEYLGAIEWNPDLRASDVALSPDGRWLLLSRYGQRTADPQATLVQHLIDLDSGERQSDAFDPSFVFDLAEWSPDGLWLARLGDGFVSLLAPATGEQRLVLHNYRDCTGLAWAD